MEEKKNEKAGTVALVLAVLCLSFVDDSAWKSVGIYSGCGLQGRLLYHFFHANFLHALLNAWCLLSVVFLFRPGWGRLLLAYLAASSFPVDTLSGIVGGMDFPTIGLSGIVYFLFASLSFQVRRRWYYQGWMLFYLIIGFLFPQTNAWLHLYCYVLGLAYALLNKPYVRK